MQFLKTIFWVILAVAIVLFASSNWDKIATIDLWADIQADVKLPVLVIGAGLIGFLPTFILYRARIWSLTRRLETVIQSQTANGPLPPRAEKPIPPVREQERQATDSKAWPAK